MPITPYLARGPPHTILDYPVDSVYTNQNYKLGYKTNKNCDLSCIELSLIFKYFSAPSCILRYDQNSDLGETNKDEWIESMQHTFNCNSNLTILTSHSGELTHNTTPTHCPCCSKPTQPKDTTGWDYYGMQLNATAKYAFHMLVVLPRQLNQTNINLINSHVDSYQKVGMVAPKYTKGHSHQTTLGTMRVTQMSDAQLAEHNFRNLPIGISHGILQIHATCSNCCSKFEFEVNETTHSTQHKPLEYCPYCGTPTLVLVSKEYNYWKALANHYDKPEPVIQAAFVMWQQVTNYPSFSQYMTALPNILSKELTYNPVKIERHTHKARKPKIHTVKLTLPKPPKLTTHTNVVGPFPTIKMYNKCTICECDQPSRTLSAYCEPCYLFTLTQHITYNPKGGC